MSDEYQSYWTGKKWLFGPPETIEAIEAMAAEIRDLKARLGRKEGKPVPITHLGPNPFVGTVKKIPGHYHYQIGWLDGEIFAERKDKGKYTHAVVPEGAFEIGYCKDSWSAQKKQAALLRKGVPAHIVKLKETTDDAKP